ncbi:PepSY domain-containing protein [Methyloprofundus sedimenti]|nr:PepSY domain-containing protein [Methyloprofundus sedimenti]
MKKVAIKMLASTLFVFVFCSASLGQTDHDIAKRLRDSDKIKPLEVILRQYSEQYPGQVIEVELETEHEQYIYQIELLDRQGIIWKLRVDATTGELLMKQKDH